MPHALTVLKLSVDHLQTIRTHAERTYPEECCGLLLGQLKPDCKTVVEVWPTENAWTSHSADVYPSAEIEMSKRQRYEIAPEVMLKVQKQARESNLDIIGIYHSHPDHSAVPSEMDRVLAWPVYSYIIVSVQQGTSADLNNWSLDDNQQFQLEEMITLDSP